MRSERGERIDYNYSFLIVEMRVTRLFPPLVVLLALAAAPVAAQDPFEGLVQYRVAGGHTMDMYIKGDRVRSELAMGGNTMAAIMNLETRQMQMLMSGQRMVMTMALPDESMEHAGGEVEVSRTGRTDVVAGHRCEIVKVTDQRGGRSEVCGATDLGSFVMARAPMQREPTPAWARGMENFFPLRVTDAAKQEVVMEVTKIERQDVPESMFTVPEGYRTMTMPGM